MGINVQTYGNRWYDKNPDLSKYIEKLKDLKKGKRDTILHEMMKLIFKYDDKLIDKHILEFPLACRRWYDKEPDTWLVHKGHQALTLFKNIKKGHQKLTLGVRPHGGV